MSKMLNKVLIIDDEGPIRKFLRTSLTTQNYAVEEVATGREGINQTAKHKPDLVLVDLGLSDMDGKQVIKELREWTPIPIIVLTARDQEQEKIAALDAGADDYVTKPFDLGELLARIRVCLRRSLATASEPILTCGELAVDLIRRRVTVKGQEIKLTPIEYEILKMLIKNTGRVLTHTQILQAIWGNKAKLKTHCIRVYISHLRHKIEDDPVKPRYIVSEAGVGYCLNCK
jgi:Response regulators consisting of a CheY-like receiver domain and a winged-helix DNA-binding domain